jgi:hypothetical protein
MTREIRLRCSALLFLVTIILHFGLSGKGSCFLITTLTKLSSVEPVETQAIIGIYSILAGLLGTAVAFFASEAMGLLFSSIWGCLLSLLPRKGTFFDFKSIGKIYESEWQGLHFSLSKYVIKKYENAEKNDTNKGRIKERLRHFSDDVYLSYFWQRANKQLVEWVSRRYTSLFVYGSAFVGLLLANLLSFLLILNLGLNVAQGNWILLIVSLLFIVIFYRFALVSGTEALQMIDLWLMNASDTNIRVILKRLDRQLIIRNKRE